VTQPVSYPARQLSSVARSYWAQPQPVLLNRRPWWRAEHPMRHRQQPGLTCRQPKHLPIFEEARDSDQVSGVAASVTLSAFSLVAARWVCVRAADWLHRHDLLAGTRLLCHACCMARQTGAELYFEARAAESPEYRQALEAARARIAAVDRVVRALDERRRNLGLSKAELARQAGMRPEVVRRILGAGPANPTLSTVISLASAMSMDVTISAPTDRTQSDASETRRRTA
jgi:DNA-binding phage protein